MNTIRTIRKQRKWTQFELAKRAGIQPADVSRLDSGRLKPSRAQAERLAAALGVPADSLMAPAWGGSL